MSKQDEARETDRVWIEITKIGGSITIATDKLEGSGAQILKSKAVLPSDSVFKVLEAILDVL